MIYTASKTKHAHIWKGFRDQGYPIISTWIDEAGVGETEDFNDLWQRCINESATCDAMVIYCEPNDVLKGAWVELGVALSHNIPVFAFGIEGFSIGKYQGIKHCRSVFEAICEARAVCVRKALGV